jgi:hypothetical protein
MRNCGPIRIIRENATEEERSCAYFYAQGMSICQLLGDGILEWEIVGECFFSFFKKKQGWGRVIGNCWRLKSILIIQIA